MSKIKTAIGLMSGTSMDGIDAAIIRTNGKNMATPLFHLSVPYADSFRQELKTALSMANAVVERDDRPGTLKAVENKLTLLHSNAVFEILDKNKLNSRDIDVIGFHGQTVLHRPQKKLTLQLGDGALLAQKTGIRVVYDMRANDMIHGGQGAPLAPVYHQALAKKFRKKLNFPLAFVNIGGLSNLTFITENGEIAASFDCGPGNVLIDQWVAMKSQYLMDYDGKFGLHGQVKYSVFKRLQQHPFFRQTKPGTLDWRDFEKLTDELSIEDGAATLAYITAYSLFASFRHLDNRPRCLLIGGGGIKNQAIIAFIKQLGQQHAIDILTTPEIALDGDFIEAEAWGYLAVRALFKLPLTYPQTTGCVAPVSGGTVVQP